MDRTTRDRVLTALDECDIGLPEDRLTLEKISERAFGFQFESGEMLSFWIERHPTIYLSDMGVPGVDASHARFHVLTEYQLDLNDETWHIEELSSTFEYEPWLVIEASFVAIERTVEFRLLERGKCNRMISLVPIPAYTKRQQLQVSSLNRWQRISPISGATTERRHTIKMA